MKKSLKKPYLWGLMLVMLAGLLLAGGCGSDTGDGMAAEPGIAVEVTEAAKGSIVNSTVVRGNVEIGRAHV